MCNKNNLFITSFGLFGLCRQYTYRSISYKCLQNEAGANSISLRANADVPKQLKKQNPLLFVGVCIKISCILWVPHIFQKNNNKKKTPHEKP